MPFLLFKKNPPSQRIPYLRPVSKSLLYLWIFSACILSGGTKSSDHGHAQEEAEQCGEILKQVIKDQAKAGLISPNKCPVSHQLAQWFEYQRPGATGATFEEISTFVRRHPNWPQLSALEKQAELALGSDGNTSPETIAQWFEKHPPQTPIGLKSYARALMHLQKRPNAQKVVQSFWINKDFSLSEAMAILSEFKGFIKVNTHRVRLDRLLMEDKRRAAQEMLPWVTDEDRSCAQARLALSQGKSDAKAKWKGLTEAQKKLPGVLYHHIKWCRIQKQNTQMTALLLAAPPPPQDFADLWWKERNLLVRRLLDEHQYQNAYRVVRAHHLTSGEDFANAEWLAGWIALRFLKKPHQAIPHFQRLAENVSSPISLSRAYYWLARAYEQMKNIKEATHWMAKAKSYPGTYYGQLALHHHIGTPANVNASMKAYLSKGVPIHAWHHPIATPEERRAFNKHLFVSAVIILGAIDEKRRAEVFLLALAKQIKTPVQQVFLIDLAQEKLSLYAGVLTSKKTQTIDIPLIHGAFPVLSQRRLNGIPAHTNIALAHAIIRQESRFDQNAVSSAGATGLMQLMPATAKQTAAQSRLTMGDLKDPSINVPIGCAHVSSLLNRFHGSIILTLAAYNAGAHIVEKWLPQYGDPRHPQRDMVDWIEWIPYAETRNYVQRVLENYAVYKNQLR